MTLPAEFLGRMKKILGDGYEAFEESYSEPHRRGVRVNTLKLPMERSRETGLCGEPVPFSPFGFYLAENDDIGIGHSPFHHAGAVYSQEPSAMSAATALDAQPGERILDMCAAPGGKTTQIAAQLRGKGLLYANEYVRSRAGKLLSNVERMGIANAVVTSLHPDDIADAMEGCFDRVLVDAPCSGEGMFRRDDVAIAEWSPEHVKTCAARQAGILDSAARCVREGGVMVYSTCTFSPEENELCIAAFLERHPDFSLEPIAAKFGRAALPLSDKYDLTLARRVYPMDGGEGHFVARMRREGEAERRADINAAVGADASRLPAEAAKMLDECLCAVPDGKMTAAGECVFVLPEGYEAMPKLPVIRAGIMAGELKKGRAEPSHALFMSRRPEECRRCLDLAPDSAALNAFLHGEEIACPDEYSGFTAVACGGVITGFGKCSGGRLKNRYPKGLRES